MSEHPKTPVVATVEDGNVPEKLPASLTRFPRRMELGMKLGGIEPSEAWQMTYQEGLTGKAELDEFLEAAPNLNEQFTDEIQMVRDAFAEDGFDIAPITVLETTEYKQAERIITGGRARDDERVSDGLYIWGHSLVRDRPGFGNDYILNMSAHESAHSIGSEFNYIAKYRELVNPGTPKFLRGVLQSMRDRKSKTEFSSFPAGSMLKFPWNESVDGTLRGRVHQQGRFWNEAYADLKRVRVLRKLGCSTNFPDSEWHEYVKKARESRYRYVDGETEVPLFEEDANVAIGLPVEFLYGTRSGSDQNAREAVQGVSNLAGYGLQLLDERIPGLFNDLEQGLFDAAAQRRFIQKVNSVQPGLYRQIARISRESGQPFQDGFLDIVFALGLENDTVHHLSDQETVSAS